MTDASPDRRLETDELLRHLADAARVRADSDRRSLEDLDRVTDEIATEHERRGTFDAAFRAEVARAARAREPAVAVSRATSIWLPLAATLLIATALAFVVVQRAERADRLASGVGLPTFSLEAEGVEDVRGLGSTAPSPATLVAVPGKRFRVVLRPSEAPDRPLDARVFVRRGDGSIVPWLAAQARLEIGARGVVRLDDLPGDAWRELAPGELTLLLVVGEADALPGTAALERALARDSAVDPESRPWRLVRQPFSLEAPTSTADPTADPAIDS